ncbi:fungal hydrophobin-domain-containing protein [Gymnopilus junonius]|uniref:Hydrophobin n=1 Tax=Gymnopilus junonius TaxID=109634 RepID=A0A9P5NXG8_GYMJU|nr:fungal hydrophobin-domain-containing protein [Gymnopilus junonius]
MFFKFATLLAVAFGALSVFAFSCNTGAIQCCGSVQTAEEYNANAIADLVGVAVSAITGQVGLECSPITGIGPGTGANCASAPVCCEHTFSNQLIGINCTPAVIGA